MKTKILFLENEWRKSKLNIKKISNEEWLNLPTEHTYADREPSSEYDKQWRMDNKDRIKINNKRYKSEHPDIVRKCSRTKRAKRKGWKSPQPINKHFKGSHLHHLHVFDSKTGKIDHRISIFIPSQLHTSVWHSNKNRESMIAINLKVIQWYYGLTIKW
ncbi:MAG: hypothetical protein KAJ19_23775 [Gammaproteobacteria bacterium]|nr:hypothetical protein [Gammaproteobacteria bacterium]